jgi:subtilase family serine protease
MRARLSLAALILAALALVAALMGSASGQPQNDSGGVTHRPVCDAVPVGVARCHAQIVTGGRSSRRTTTTTGGTTTTTSAGSSHAGYGPSDLESAYALPSATGGGGQTVAVVDAFDDPNAESDLGVYRSFYGLSACTTANGCFAKVNQTGGTAPPGASGSWAQEISLDLDMVSAICPNCHILLVEASSATLTDLGAAVDEAASLGANEISNSYGASEFSAEASFESHYNHPGVAVTASSGDSGFGVQYPAASQFVTGAGGTSLSTASNARGWSETAWSSAGSGCSAFISKPAWQTDPGCSNRTVADVSADADPNTGVAVFDSFRFRGQSGWLVFGGTSVASPIVASVYALAGNAATVTYGSFPYNHAGSLFDVTSGSNGSCGGSYLCTAGPGYDGPTGLGTPDGPAAF